MFCVAVVTAVNLVFAVGQFKNCGKLLFARGYTARIFAENNVRKRIGQAKCSFVDSFAVFYHIYRCAGCYVADNVGINVYIGINFNHIFSTHTTADRIHYHRNGA